MNTSNGKFTPTTKAAFAPGGTYSTPNQRKDDSPGNFLLPKDKKYPYKINGQISCQLLKAAISRAGQNKEDAVKKKAQSLYDDHCA